MNSDTSSSQLQEKSRGLIIRGDDNSLLRSYWAATWMGASELAVDWQVVQSGSSSTRPTMPPCESAAIAYHEDRNVEEQIDTILNIVSIEGFEDGMEGRTSQVLHLFVSEHPIAGMQQLIARLNAKYMNQAVAADIVRVLGKIEHERSHEDRRYMAECLLYSELPLARDAGAVALSELADERSIPALQRAIEAEPILTLKTDMQASVDELTNDSDGVHTQEARP